MTEEPSKSDEIHESVRALGRELDKTLHLTQFADWFGRQLEAHPVKTKLIAYGGTIVFLAVLMLSDYWSR